MSKKFVQVAFKKNMVKYSEDGSELWVFCSSQVKNFAKENFKEGEEVEFEIEEKDGQQWIKGYIKKVGTNEVGNSSPSTDKESTSKNITSYYGKHDRSVQESIKRQAVAHATSRVMICLQGQVDRNDCIEIYNTLYDAILTKVNGQ